MLMKTLNIDQRSKEIQESFSLDPGPQFVNFGWYQFIQCFCLHRVCLSTSSRKNCHAHQEPWLSCHWPSTQLEMLVACHWIVTNFVSHWKIFKNAADAQHHIFSHPTDLYNLIYILFSFSYCMSNLDMHIF